MGQCTSWTRGSKEQGHGTQQSREKNCWHRTYIGVTDRRVEISKGVWRFEAIRGAVLHDRRKHRKTSIVEIIFMLLESRSSLAMYVISEKSVRIDCTRLHTEHIRNGSSENRCSSLAGLCSRPREDRISRSHGSSCWNLFLSVESWSTPVDRWFRDKYQWWRFPRFFIRAK